MGAGLDVVLVLALLLLVSISCGKDKIHFKNAYIQEDGGIKVLSNGKIVDDKEPSQVQDWVNSLFKYGPSPPAGDEAAEANVTMNSAEPLTVECKRGPSVKYVSPARFGVLTNGSIMRESPCLSSSTSKPHEDAVKENFKYRDLSETTSNSTTDSTASTFSFPPFLRHASLIF